MIKKDKAILAAIIAFYIGFVFAFVISYAAKDADDFQQRQDEQRILCIDRALGVVYSCFENEQGNIEIKINPEGNRVIAGTVDALEPTTEGGGSVG
jgi:hypothetical protein